MPRIVDLTWIPSSSFNAIRQDLDVVAKEKNGYRRAVQSVAPQIRKLRIYVQPDTQEVALAITTVNEDGSKTTARKLFSTRPPPLPASELDAVFGIEGHGDLLGVPWTLPPVDKCDMAGLLFHTAEAANFLSSILKLPDHPAPHVEVPAPAPVTPAPPKPQVPVAPVVKAVEPGIDLGPNFTPPPALKPVVEVGSQAPKAPATQKQRKPKATA